MDFWASLEHELSYKLTSKKSDAVTVELKDCANVISDIDMRMQNLHNITMTSESTKEQDSLFK